MKISVIMPTYNDSKYITQTLESLVSQTYKNWELIIIDDGSTDNTREIIHQYIKENKCDDKIKYFYQENMDQLNAIQNGVKYITGDYVYILHSDDLLFSNNSFEDFIDFEKLNKGYDLYMGTPQIINAENRVTGEVKLPHYKGKNYEVAIMYLWLGRNILSDSSFFKSNVFKEKVSKSYLTWNMPAWLDIDNSSTLKVKILPFYTFKYRLDGNNYIDNEIGKQNVLNGELRTAIYLMNAFNIPMYSLQYYTYRVFNKLKLRNVFKPIYLNKTQKEKFKIIDFIIRKRFPNGYENNKYFYSIYKFYKNKSNRVIEITNLSDEIKIFKGCDVRLFNNLLNKNELNEFYYWFMDEMQIGFSKVKCEAYQKSKVEDILRFFDIDKEVEVLEK